MGLLAEMLARTYHESQDKPIYVIREIREASELSQPDRTLTRTPEVIDERDAVNQ